MTFIDPPWRLDPFQNIVNANFGGLGPWLVCYVWYFPVTPVYPITITNFNSGRPSPLPSTMTLLDVANIDFQCFPRLPAGQRASDLVTPFMLSNLVAWISPTRNFNDYLGPHNYDVSGFGWDAYAVFNLGHLRRRGITAFDFITGLTESQSLGFVAGINMAVVKVGFTPAASSFISVFPSNPAVPVQGFPLKSFERRAGPGLLVTEGPSPGFPPQPTSFLMSDFFWSFFFPSYPPPGVIIHPPPNFFAGNDPGQPFAGYINPLFTTDPWGFRQSVPPPGGTIVLQTNQYVGNPFMIDFGDVYYVNARSRIKLDSGQFSVNMTTGQVLTGQFAPYHP